MKINKLELKNGQYVVHLSDNSKYVLEPTEVNYILSVARKRKKNFFMPEFIVKNDKLLLKKTKVGTKPLERIDYYSDNLNKEPMSFYNFFNSNSKVLNPVYLSIGIDSEGFPFVKSLGNDWRGLRTREVVIEEGKIEVKSSYLELKDKYFKLSEETFNFYMANYGITQGRIDNEMFPLINENKEIVFFNRNHKVWKEAHKKNRTRKKDLVPGKRFLYGKNIVVYVFDYSLDEDCDYRRPTFVYENNPTSYFPIYNILEIDRIDDYIDSQYHFNDMFRDKRQNFINWKNKEDYYCLV